MLYNIDPLLCATPTFPEHTQQQFGAMTGLVVLTHILAQIGIICYRERMLQITSLYQIWPWPSLRYRIETEAGSLFIIGTERVSARFLL